MVAPEKVRFEHKAEVAVELGIIEAGLATGLKEFYAARNMIHIHAELKKGADWDWRSGLRSEPIYDSRSSAIRSSPGEEKDRRRSV